MLRFRGIAARPIAWKRDSSRAWRADQQHAGMRLNEAGTGQWAIFALGIFGLKVQSKSARVLTTVIPALQPVRKEASRR